LEIPGDTGSRIKVINDLKPLFVAPPAKTRVGGLAVKKGVEELARDIINFYYLYFVN